MFGLGNFFGGPAGQGSTGNVYGPMQPPSSPWGQVMNSLTPANNRSQPGQGAMFNALGPASQQLTQMGRPHFAGQPVQENAVPGLQGFKPPQAQSPFDGGMFGGGGIPPQLLEMLKQRQAAAMPTIPPTGQTAPMPTVPPAAPTVPMPQPRTLPPWLMPGGYR